MERILISITIKMGVGQDILLKRSDGLENVQRCRRTKQDTGPMERHRMHRKIKDPSYETEPEIYRRYRDEEDEGILFDERY